jgi:hypothetical protein
MPSTPPDYVINRGVNPNDGLGDTLRDSFGKLNSAVQELYDKDLNELGNVDTTGVANGNTLVYNSSTGNWEASSTVAASALNDLTDVTIAGATPTGQLLRWNGAAWANTSVATDDISEGGNLYYTNTRVNTAFDTRLATKSTADLSEDPGATGVSGTQYFTDARADARISNALAGDITIGGDLIVQGATVTVESNTVTIGDNIIVLNADEAGTPSLDSGIEVERGTSTNVQLLWNETTDKWQFTNDGATYVDMGTASIFTGDTDGVSEGVSNLYYTTTRHNTDFDTRLATKSTADVAEDPAATVSSGTMYYTDARVNTRIAATNIGDLNNVDTTGVANNSALRYSTGAGNWIVSASLDPIIAVGQETITGANGVDTIFTMSTVAPTTITAIVTVNGIVQEPTTAYSISGSSITFTSPPPNGARIGVRALGSGEQGFLIRSADFNASSTGRYGVDTSGNTVIATLPGSPATGEAIYFMDAGGAFSSNTFTVDRNGNTINGSASNLAKTTDGESFGVMYTGSTWRTY